MFSKTLFQTLFAYHWHTNGRLLAGAAKLAETDYFANPGYGRGSVHVLLFHLLATHYAWRTALETAQQPAPLLAEDFPDLAALRTGLEREQAAWQALLSKVSAEQIEGEIALTTRRGRTSSVAYWRVLQHLILHGMQHHTELAQLLTAQGQSPGDIDFIFFR